MSAQDLANAAFAAGFRGDGLVTAIAIGLAESGGDAGAKHRNSDADYQHGNTLDRGAWQINDWWHGEVSDACAFDFACAAQAVYRISDGGKNWSQWATYTAGVYLNHLGDAQAAAAIAASSPSTASPPASRPGQTPPGVVKAIPILGVLFGVLALYELAEVIS